MVLMTVGHMQQRPMVNKAAGSDLRNKINPMGNHAKGEIGRNT
jgi:hypothetical protein